MHNTHIKKTHIFRTILIIVLISFISTTLVPPSFAQVLSIPANTSLVPLSPAFTPTLVRGIKVYPDNPLKFDFIVDSGDTGLKGDELKTESEKLIRYFLASLTIPENDLWVNLSPYEKDRIVPDELGKTEMGMDMLAQDYLLKQITASLIYPEGDTGKKFWDRVYKEAYAKYGTTNIPVDTFNKVWIMPEKAVVYEQEDKAFVVESKLKVMLEEDYIAAQSSTLKAQSEKTKAGDVSDRTRTLTSQIVKDIVIPELEKEVNEGKNFAQLRQIYNAIILGYWFKTKLKTSILNKVYSDQHKTAGIDLSSKATTDQIYQQYLDTFKKGVCNMMKVEYDPYTKKNIPRKYFAGGVNVTNLEVGKNLEFTKNSSACSSLIKRVLFTFVLAVTLALATPQGAIAQNIEPLPDTIPTLIIPKDTTKYLKDTNDKRPPAPQPKLRQRPNPKTIAPIRLAEGIIKEDENISSLAGEDAIASSVLLSFNSMTYDGKLKLLFGAEQKKEEMDLWLRRGRQFVVMPSGEIRENWSVYKNEITPLNKVQKNFATDQADPFEEFYKKVQADPAKTFIVVDAGPGAGVALKEMAGKFRLEGINNVKLYGFSHIYYPEWAEGEYPEITWILDDFKNIDKYFGSGLEKLGAINFMFSHLGFYHIGRGQGQSFTTHVNFMEKISGLLASDAEVVYDYSRMLFNEKRFTEALSGLYDMRIKYKEIEDNTVQGFREAMIVRLTKPSVVDSSTIPAVIREKFAQAGNEVDFETFMTWVNGYYYNNFAKIGSGRAVAEGGFDTFARYEHFAKVVARQIVEVWERMVGEGKSKDSGFSIVEMGAGNGTLAKNILKYLEENNPKLFDVIKYVIVDFDGPLAQMQKANLEKYNELGKVGFIRKSIFDVTSDDFKKAGFEGEGIFLSNELADDLSGNLIESQGNGVFSETYVREENGVLKEILSPLSRETKDYLNANEIVNVPSGVRFLIRPESFQKWQGMISNNLKRGAVLTIDYGGKDEEIQTGVWSGALRNERNLKKIFYQIGKGEITGDVNFKELAGVGNEAGLTTAGYTSQSAFLRYFTTPREDDFLSEGQSRELFGSPGFKVLMQTKGIEDRNFQGFKASQEVGAIYRRHVGVKLPADFKGKKIYYAEVSAWTEIFNSGDRIDDVIKDLTRGYPRKIAGSLGVDKNNNVRFDFYDGLMERSDLSKFILFDGRRKIVFDFNKFFEKFPDQRSVCALSREDFTANYNAGKELGTKILPTPWDFAIVQREGQDYLEPRASSSSVSEDPEILKSNIAEFAEKIVGMYEGKGRERFSKEQANNIREWIREIRQNLNKLGKSAQGVWSTAQDLSSFKEGDIVFDLRSEDLYVYRGSASQKDSVLLQFIELREDLAHSTLNVPRTRQFTDFHVLKAAGSPIIIVKTIKSGEQIVSLQTVEYSDKLAEEIRRYYKIVNDVDIKRIKEFSDKAIAGLMQTKELKDVFFEKRTVSNLDLGQLRQKQNALHQFKIDIETRKMEIRDRYDLPTPPILVLHLRSGYYLIDGHTRTYAAVKMGKASLPAIVIDLEPQDIFDDLLKRARDAGRWDFYQALLAVQGLYEAYTLENTNPATNLGYYKILEDGTDSELYKYYANAFSWTRASAELADHVLRKIAEFNATTAVQYLEGKARVLRSLTGLADRNRVIQSLKALDPKKIGSEIEISSHALQTIAQAIGVSEKVEAIYIPSGLIIKRIGKKLPPGIFNGQNHQKKTGASPMISKTKNLENAASKFSIFWASPVYKNRNDYNSLPSDEDGYFNIPDVDYRRPPKIIPSDAPGITLVDIPTGYAVRKDLSKKSDVVLASRAHAICTSYIIKGRDQKGSEILIQGHFKARDEGEDYNYIDDQDLKRLLQEKTNDLEDVQIVVSPQAKERVTDDQTIEGWIGPNVNTITILFREKSMPMLSAFSSKDGVAFSFEGVVSDNNFMEISWKNLMPGTRVLEEAMRSASNIKAPGGIDFNAKSMNVETRGESIDLSVPENWQNVRPEDIIGFTPVIINVTPVTDFMKLLGLTEKDVKYSEASHVKRETQADLNVSRDTRYVSQLAVLKEENG